MKHAPIVAIVDDDASVRRSLQRLVRSAGYAAEAFGSAREFLEWLPRGQAACLVLDVHMHEMSGFDLQERLAVPVVFITAHDDEVTLDRIEVRRRRSPALAVRRGRVLEAIRQAVGADAQAETPSTNTRHDAMTAVFAVRRVLLLLGLVLVLSLRPPREPPAAGHPRRRRRCTRSAPNCMRRTGFSAGASASIATSITSVAVP